MYFSHYIKKKLDAQSVDITRIQAKDLYNRLIQIPIKRYQTIDNIKQSIFDQCVPKSISNIIKCYFIEQYSETLFRDQILFHSTVQTEQQFGNRNDSTYETIQCKTK